METTTPEWIAIWTAAATSLTLLLVIVPMWQLREAGKTRDVQLLLEMLKLWNSPELMPAQEKQALIDSEELLALARDAYSTPPSSTQADSAEMYRQISPVPDFFEILGALEKNVRLIDTVWGVSVIDAWWRWEPTVRWLNQREDARLRTQFPNARTEGIYENFGRLANDLETLTPRWRNRTGAFWRKARRR